MQPLSESKGPGQTTAGDKLATRGDGLLALRAELPGLTAAPAALFLANLSPRPYGGFFKASPGQSGGRG